MKSKSNRRLYLNLTSFTPIAMTIIIQPSKREKDKISVWLKDYKFGDVNLEEVVKVVG